MNAGRIDRSSLSRLRVGGADHVDFLERLATNELAGLTPGKGAATFFLERTGRVVDRVIAIKEEDSFLLIGNPGRGEALREWLFRYVIAEDVEVDDLSATTGLVTVLGEAAAEVLGGILAVGLADLPRYHHRRSGDDEETVRVVRAEDVGGKSFHAITPLEKMPALERVLADLPEVTGPELESLRVAAGVPAFGTEYDERTIPLELRADDAISFTKGCFIGQEVVARLHNHQRVKRALVRLRLEDGDPPPPDSPILEGEETIGLITSAARAGQEIVALGFVKSGREEPGGRFRIGPDARDAQVLSLTPNGETS